MAEQGKERVRTPRPGISSGIVFVVIGVLGLLHEAGAVNVDARWFWPVLLVAIGGALVVRGLIARRGSA